MYKKVTGIYLIKNTINNKMYVGSAIDIQKRWWDHKKLLRGNRHHSKYLQASWNKYGEFVFTFSVLLKCTQEELIKLEQSFIDQLNPQFNMRKKAESMLGYKHSIESREKMSLSRKGIKHSQERKERRKLLGIIYPAKKVEMLDLLTGNVIAIFNSTKEASIQTGFPRKTLEVCLSGRNFTAHNYRWKYFGEEEKGKSTWKKPVVQILNGRVVAEFLSIKEAGKVTGIRSNIISMCLAKKYHTGGGFVWKYKTEI